MSLTTLKFLRLLIPGIFIFTGFFIAYPNDTGGLKLNFNSILDFDFKDALYLAAFIFFGVLYHVTKLRAIFWNPFLSVVQNNIKNSLIKPYLNILSEEKIAQLKKGRKLLNIFYHFVDTIPSITVKSNLVRFNGLIWTSFVDLTIISLFAFLGMVVKLFFYNTIYNTTLLFCFAFIALISFSLIYVMTKTHLKLGNEQLEMIIDLCDSELRKRLTE